MHQDSITIAGLTERVTYHNAETSYSVIKVSVRSKRELVAVVGLGDKVMPIPNDYDKNVYNGDLGFITSIDESE